MQSPEANLIESISCEIEDTQFEHDAPIFLTDWPPLGLQFYKLVLCPLLY